MEELERVLALVRQRGHRITPQRRLIVADVLSHGSAVSAQAVNGSYNEFQLESEFQPRAWLELRLELP